MNDRSEIRTGTKTTQLINASKYFTCFIFTSAFFCQVTNAQQSNLPLNYEWMQETEARFVKQKGFALSSRLIHYEADSTLAAIMQPDSMNPEVTAAFPLHTSLRPWIEQGHPLRKNVIYSNAHNHYIPQKFDPRIDTGRAMTMYVRRRNMPHWFKRYHWQNSLLQVERAPQKEEPLFRIYIDPLLNLTYFNAAGNILPVDSGSVQGPGQGYISSRGIIARGDIGKKVSFETTFRENQAFFPGFINEFANATGVIPGNGRWKVFKVDGYDYASASGYVSWTPRRFFNAQAGHGKFFVGDGYRSLLLSDNSFNYPYIRFTGWFGPDKLFQYTTIFASLMNLTPGNVVTPPGTERLFQKKAASFYQLAMKIGRVGEISLFQGLIVRAADDKNKTHLSLAYANPLIFSSLPFTGLSDRNNYLVGATFRFDLLKTLRIYGQWLADDLGKKGTVFNKTGLQAGIKYFNAFTLPHLHLQVEYNRVNPYTYAASDSAQSYTHYKQPLAHPLGANFSETIFSLQYKAGDFFLHFRYSMATIGTDYANFNFGQNVFISDAHPFYSPLPGPVEFGQGEKTALNFMDVRIGYMISYASNFNISAGFTSRKVSPGATLGADQLVYVALRTSLDNTYFDFFRK